VSPQILSAACSLEPRARPSRFRAPRSALAILAVLGSSVASAATLLLDEALDDGACNSSSCSVSGGSYGSRGWKVAGAGSKIMFTLPRAVACGSAEVTFTNLDPIAGGTTGEYVNFLGVYEGAHGNNWTASGNEETSLQVAANCDRCTGVALPDAWRDERLKFKGIACSWDHPECGGYPATNRYLPAQGAPGINWASNLAVQWTATIAWDCSGASYKLQGNGSTWTANGTWAWPSGNPDPRPHLRYLFVGRDSSGGAGSYLKDLIIVHAKAFEASTCNCAPPPQCGDGTCNGAETCGSCAQDCGACPPRCGDGTCNGVETCGSCAQDCGACPPTCGDDACDGAETCGSCARDCGACDAGTHDAGRPDAGEDGADAVLGGCASSAGGPLAALLLLAAGAVARSRRPRRP